MKTEGRRHGNIEYISGEINNIYFFFQKNRYIPLVSQSNIHMPLENFSVG